ncbi:MAG TPA: HAMP domain-containing sensor histidine kinase [Wenzhouxiangellaceae bacterium]|nr:HAMP domain-containing sensor histidine kinase [Wenzhouxiangellaceae bacterium]
MNALNRFFKGSIKAKLVKVFVMQVAAISAATVLGVYAAAVVVERGLMQQALNGEAQHFWENRAENPEFPLPNTEHLVGYLSGPGVDTPLPEWLTGHSPGYGRVHKSEHNTPVLHVTERNGQRLYLVFDENQVSNLAFYFGIAPLTGVLLVIYVLAWMGYIMSRRAVSAVVQLAEIVRSFDFQEGRFEQMQFEELADITDPEVLALVNAFEQFTTRLERFVARERNFTRNASHELRTPLAVLKANLDLVRKNPESPRLPATIERMSRTVRDMESLVETLLLLARESESKLSWSSVVLNDLVADQLEQVEKAIDRPSVKTEFHADCLLETEAPERVLGIIFHNLLRNAMTFTEDGTVSVHIDRHSVTIRDTGCGMTEEDLERVFEPFYRAHDRSNEGYGLGLAIVARLARRFGWPLEVESEVGAGTSFRVSFPKARRLAFVGQGDAEA